MRSSKPAAFSRSSTRRDEIAVVTWLPYADEAQQRFEVLAAAYDACRVSFRELSTASQWEAMPGSAALKDRATLGLHQPPLPDKLDLTISRISHDYLYAASELLSALAALYKAQEVLFAPAVLARSAVEHTAHVMWIIGKSVDSAEDRLARAFLEELAGAEEAKKTAGHLMPKSSPDYRQRAQRFKDIQDDGRKCFDPPLAYNGNRAVLNGVQLPRPHELVISTYLDASPQADAKSAEGVYDFLSNFTHPTLYATRELFSVDYSGREPTVSVTADEEDHEKLARLAIAPFYAAFKRVTDYHRWDDAPLMTLTKHIDVLLPGTLVRPAETTGSPDA